jgi:hypothetical protein
VRVDELEREVGRLEEVLASELDATCLPDGVDGLAAVRRENRRLDRDVASLEADAVLFRECPQELQTGKPFPLDQDLAEARKPGAAAAPRARG